MADYVQITQGRPSCWMDRMSHLRSMRQRRQMVYEKPKLTQSSIANTMELTRKEAEKFCKSFQYLYYCKCPPQLPVEDFQYDKFCRNFYIQGGGGSDLETSYTQAEKDMAEMLLKVPGLAKEVINATWPQPTQAELSSWDY